MITVLLLLATVGFSGCFHNRALIAVLNAPVVTGPAPLDVAFDLSYCRDPASSPLSYLLDFGDGSDPTTGEDFNFIIHHTYEVGGTFTCQLTVTDAEGNRAIDQLTITVDEIGPPVGLLVGDAAPDFTSSTTDGKEISLSDYRGYIVLLDFWGAWCPPCRARMPHLQDIYDQFSARGLVIILISTDQKKQDAIDFLTSHGYTDFVSVWEPGYKSQNPIARLYQVKCFPHTFLLDRQGVIRYVGHPDHLETGLLEAIL